MLKFCVVFPLLFAFSLGDNTRSSLSSPNLRQLQMIEQSMNKSANPCDNFYNHACGNYVKHFVTENYNEIDSMLKYSMNLKLKELLEIESHNATNEATNRALEKMSVYYSSCLNRKLGNVLNYFNHIKPATDLEWPLLQQRENGSIEWSPSNFDIFKLLGVLSSYDFNNVLIKTLIYPLPSGKMQVDFLLPDVNSTDQLTAEKVKSTLASLGLSPELTNKYSGEYLKLDDFWNQTYDKYAKSENEETMTYAELSSSYPQLWTVLEAMHPQKFQNDDEVFITNLDYYKFLLPNLVNSKKFHQPLVNYLFLKFIHYMDKDGQIDCITDTREKMDMVFNYLYFKRLYQPKSENYNSEIKKITSKVYKYILDLLQENHMQLNATLVDKLKEKISHLKINIGNLPANIDESHLDVYFTDIQELDVGDYFKNHLILLKHRGKTRFLYNQKLSHSLLYCDIICYDSGINTVLIPFDYLQAPLYDTEFYPVFLWSLIGYRLAIDFINSVDVNGLEFDKDGLETSDFGEILNSTKVNATIECLKNQDNSRDVNEILAEVIALRIAYRAFVIEDRETLSAPEFRSLPMNKLFFLNMAQYYCSSDDRDSGKVNQMVSNFEVFAEVFNCPLNGPMNPDNKCRLY